MVGSLIVVIILIVVQSPMVYLQRVLREFLMNKITKAFSTVLTILPAEWNRPKRMCRNAICGLCVTNVLVNLLSAPNAIISALAREYQDSVLNRQFSSRIIFFRSAFLLQTTDRKYRLSLQHVDIIVDSRYAVNHSGTSLRASWTQATGYESTIYWKIIYLNKNTDNKIMI